MKGGASPRSTWQTQHCHVYLVHTWETDEQAAAAACIDGGTPIVQFSLKNSNFPNLINTADKSLSSIIQ